MAALVIKILLLSSLGLLPWLQKASGPLGQRRAMFLKEYIVLGDSFWTHFDQELKLHQLSCRKSNSNKKDLLILIGEHCNLHA